MNSQTKIFAVVFGFIFIGIIGIGIQAGSNAQSSANILNQPQNNVEVLPDKSAVYRVACTDAKARVNEALAIVNNYLKNRSRSRTYGAQLQVKANEIDSVWKTLDSGQIYVSTLALANDISFLGESISNKDVESSIVYLEQFQADYKSLEAACSLY
jgi:hypothetical protein